MMTCAVLSGEIDFTAFNLFLLRADEELIETEEGIPVFDPPCPWTLTAGMKYLDIVDNDDEDED